MALLSTPAVILHSFRYSESSKIVRLATLEAGVLSAVAKGAMRPRSRFGARLQLLSEGAAQVYVKPNRDLQNLAEFDVMKQRPELAQDTHRYAAAMALAELVLRFAPAEPNPDIYNCLVADLDRLTTVPAAQLDAAALSALWGLVSALGFEPTIEGCARDGRQLPEGTALFSVADGGLLCAACAKGTNAGPGTAKLRPADRAALARLIAGRWEEVEQIPPRHAAAHRRLLVRFVLRHLSDDRELKALSLWENHSWNTTS